MKKDIPFEEASPRTGADHFRTGEMHAACARLLVRAPEGETDQERAERHHQYAGHMELARFHADAARTLIAVMNTPEIAEDGTANHERNGWREVLRERAARNVEFPGDTVRYTP